jgi:hypothetical protein
MDLNVAVLSLDRLLTSKEMSLEGMWPKPTSNSISDSISNSISVRMRGSISIGSGQELYLCREVAQR